MRLDENKRPVHWRRRPPFLIALAVAIIVTASWGFYRMSRVARSSSAQCYLKVIYKSNPREPAKPVPHALIRGLFYSENIIEPARKKLRDPDFPYYRALAQSLQVQDGRSPGVVSIECFAVGDAGEVLDEVINSFESFIGKPEFYSAKKIRSALESEIEECKDAIHREELRLDQLDPIWRNKVHPDPQTQSTIEEIAQLELGAAKQLALIETAGDAGLPDTLARISDLRWKVTSAAAKRSQPAMRASTEFFIQTSYLNALQKDLESLEPARQFEVKRISGTLTRKSVRKTPRSFRSHLLATLGFSFVSVFFLVLPFATRREP